MEYSEENILFSFGELQMRFSFWFLTTANKMKIQKLHSSKRVMLPAVL